MSFANASSSNTSSAVAEQRSPTPSMFDGIMSDNDENGVASDGSNDDEEALFGQSSSSPVAKNPRRKTPSLKALAPSTEDSEDMADANATSSASKPATKRKRASPGVPRAPRKSQATVGEDDKPIKTPRTRIGGGTGARATAKIISTRKINAFVGDYGQLMVSCPPDLINPAVDDIPLCVRYVYMMQLNAVEILFGVLRYILSDGAEPSTPVEDAGAGGAGAGASESDAQPQVVAPIVPLNFVVFLPLSEHVDTLLLVDSKVHHFLSSVNDDILSASKTVCDLITKKEEASASADEVDGDVVASTEPELVRPKVSLYREKKPCMIVIQKKLIELFNLIHSE